jgi:dephospho-CoA kinase
MLKVGLTGGIATGKSHVLSILKELGCDVIDADDLAHAAIAPGEPAYSEIVMTFGDGILASDKKIDRARLGRIVFADSDARARLNAIVHPRVFEAQKRWFDELALRRDDSEPVIAVIDAALLIETGSYQRYDCVVVVHCLPEIQLKRLMTRNNLSRDGALERIQSQMSSAEKLKYADFQIDTSGTFEETRRQVEELYTKLKQKSKERDENL